MYGPHQTSHALADLSTAAPAVSWRDPYVKAQTCWCKLCSTPLFVQTCPRNFSHPYYKTALRIRNVCRQILLPSLIRKYSHMPCRKGKWEYIQGPEYVSCIVTGFVVESSPAQNSRISFFMTNFSSSYSYERNLPQWDRLWFMDICLNAKNTTQMRDRKQFQSKNSTFSRLIFIS